MKSIILFLSLLLLSCGSDAPVVDTHIGYITKVEIIKTVDLNNNPVTEHYIWVDDVPYLVDSGTHFIWCSQIGTKVEVATHSDGYIEISGAR